MCLSYIPLEPARFWRGKCQLYKSNNQETTIKKPAWWFSHVEWCRVFLWYFWYSRLDVCLTWASREACRNFVCNRLMSKEETAWSGEAAERCLRFPSQERCFPRWLKVFWQSDLKFCSSVNKLLTRHDTFIHGWSIVIYFNIGWPPPWLWSFVFS